MVSLIILENTCIVLGREVCKYIIWKLSIANVSVKVQRKNYPTSQTLINVQLCGNSAKLSFDLNLHGYAAAEEGEKKASLW